MVLLYSTDPLGGGGRERRQEYGQTWGWAVTGSVGILKCCLQTAQKMGLAKRKQWFRKAIRKVEVGAGCLCCMWLTWIQSLMFYMREREREGGSFQWSTESDTKGSKGKKNIKNNPKTSTDPPADLAREGKKGTLKLGRDGKHQTVSFTLKRKVGKKLFCLSGYLQNNKQKCRH